MRAATYDNAHPCRRWIAAAFIVAALAFVVGYFTPLAGQTADTALTFAHRKPTTSAFISGFTLYRSQGHICTSAGCRFAGIEESVKDTTVVLWFPKLVGAPGDSALYVARHYWLNTRTPPTATLFEIDTVVMRVPVAPPPPPPPPPDTVVDVIQASGDNQTGTPGAFLTNPLTVTLADSGVAVIWRPLTGGGRMASATGFIGTPTNEPNARMGSTDGNGVASVRWQLGPATGTQTAEADIAGVGKRIFVATAHVDTAAPPPPPPPPPPTDTTPLPAGVLFADDFDAGARTNANGYVWSTPSNVNVSNAVARSGGFSLRFTYGGKPSPCGDSTAEQRLAFGTRARELWVEYYIYFPDGTNPTIGPKFEHRVPVCPTGGDANGVVSNNKFFIMWAGTYSDTRIGAEYRTDATLTPNSYMYMLQGTDLRSASKAGGEWRPAITDALRGRWVQVRFYGRISSAVGVRDGGMTLWVDGVKRIDAQTLDLVNSTGITQWNNMYLMGWANSGFTNTTNVYVDDFKIFGTNPGW